MDHQTGSCFWVGTSGWNYPDWRGSFYPPNLPQRRWLEYYATQFNALEINATFYRKFNEQTYRNWFARTSDGFRFVLKAPRTITHVKHLLDVDEEICEFDRSTHLLAEKLGLILLQIAPDTPYDLERLRNALQAFSVPSQIAVEFRHKSWLTEDAYQLLQDFGAVLVNPESPGNLLSDRLVSDIGYLRLHGRRRWYADDYTPEELDGIAEMAKRMVARGAKEVYIFFNNTASGYAARNALALQAKIRK
ncbi:MAG: DUF72 domain-containing protein [Anaerolineales bacterium]|nr:DUF72 domain-containing protein [Anaerolineales bacterium]